MDQEVAKTLGELELKLQQLEHELTAIGPHDAPPARPQESENARSDWIAAMQESGADEESLPSQPQPSGRLVDEAMEPSQTTDASEAADAIVAGDGFGGPPVFGGEELPAQPAASGQDWKVDVRETAYGEIPSEDAPASSFGHPSSFGPVADRPGPPIPPPSPTPQPPTTTPPGPPPPEHPPAPTPQPGPQPIDRAELVRFKQHLEHTMAELSEELARLLLPKPPT